MEKITKPDTVKVIITGPESTGKSTLAQQLSAHFDQPWLPEYARTYLNDLDRPYIATDLELIAKGQADMEAVALAKLPNFLFIDTSIEVIKIWSEWKYGCCSDVIEDLWQSQVASKNETLYLLLYPDIEWQDDPMREHPHEREALFGQYEKLLQSEKTDYQVIKGNDRLNQAIEAVGRLG